MFPLLNLFEIQSGEILRVFLVVLLAFVAIIFILRISGKRTLSKWNSFDFIVTIALGSTLATLILSKDVSLPAGIFAFALLVFIQFIITWLSARWGFFRSTVKSTPQFLVKNGKVYDDILKKERISLEEILAALREGGVSRMEDAGAVVLESDGTLSVIKGKVDSQSDALRNVKDF